MNAAGLIAHTLNRVVIPLGIRIERTRNQNDPEQFLPFHETLSSATEAGLSVGNYLDIAHNVKGATQDTIDHMDKLGVFADPKETIVEIGPGSGRYLEKVVRKCSPARYEIYETAAPWANYLVKKYGVIYQSTDGNSLSSTPDGSADLVHAHKVFVVTSFVDTCRYWKDMFRVCRPSGHIVFDIVTENCMDEETLNRWMGAGIQHGNYPAIIPRVYAIKFFRAKGASMVGCFIIPMKPGKTEVFVFRKSPN